MRKSFPLGAVRSTRMFRLAAHIVDGAQTFGIPGLEDAVPVPQVPLGAGLHSHFLHHGVIVAVDFIPAGNGFPSAQGELAVRDAQQSADILLPLGPEGQQFQVGIRLFAGLHALSPPDFQLVGHSGHSPLALAGHIGHAEHDGFRGKAILQIQVDDLFHLAVGQRPGKAGLCTVDEAGNHRVGAGSRGDLLPGHGGGGAGLLARGSVLLVPFQQAGTRPERKGALCRHPAAEFQVRTQLVRVCDTRCQHIQRHADIIFLRDAQLGKYQLRHRNGIAFELF